MKTRNTWMRTTLALCCALVLLLGNVAALANPVAPMTEGIYECRFTPEGREEYVAYIHFYENGVFYISLYNGGQYAAGYYELVDEGVEYYPDPADLEKTAMTDKKIVLKNLDGSEYGVVGYDSVQDMVCNLTHYYNFNFVHVTDSGHTDEDETGVNVIEYYLDGDEYSVLALKHNGTFSDMISEMYEGTWVKAGDVYTLTEEESGKSYIVTVNEDGTASYTGLEGQEHKLAALASAKIVLTLEGKLAEVAYGEMAGKIELFDDARAVTTINYAGVDRVLEGKWEMAADYSNIAISIDGVDFNAAYDNDTGLFSFAYPCSDGTKDVELPFVSVATQAKVEWVFTGENVAQITCELYSDGTCALLFEGLGTVSEGTWSLDASASPLPAWTIELVDTFEGTGVIVETDYATKFFFIYKNSAGTLEETLTLSFETFQAAQ